MLEYIRAARRRRDDKGASAVEYGLLIAAITGVLVVIVWAFIGVVGDQFESTCDAIADGAPPAAGADPTCDPAGG